MCRDCKDTGTITLLTTTEVCDCVLPDTVCSEGAVLECGGFAYRGVNGRAVRIDTPDVPPQAPEPDPACFGTINGVTLHGDPALHRDRAPTYTLEVEDSFGRRTQFTGLEKHQVDTVHVMLKAGWSAEGIRDHLNELWTAARVHESSKAREAEVTAAEARALGGFTVEELDIAAVNIASELEDGMGTRDQADVICRELVRLLVRRTMREVLGTIKRPRFVGGRLQYVEETAGVNPSPYRGYAEMILPRDPVTPEDRAFRKGIGFVSANAQCGKAEFYRRMYGGKPNLAIDCSAIEARLLAHVARTQEQRRERPDPEFPGSASPSAD